MKKLPKRYWLTTIWVLPAFLISTIIVLFLWLFWGTKLHWLRGLWFELKENSWPHRTWYKNWGGTTFVWGGFYAPGRAGDLSKVDTKIERHEHTHIEQGEMAQLMGLIIAIVVFFSFWSVNLWQRGLFIGFLIWTSSALLHYVCGGIQAVMNGEKFYRGNLSEESARSLS